MDVPLPIIRESPADDEPRTERRKIRERQALSAADVAEALRLEGRTELSRAWQALAWSGLAAGLSMGLSLLGEAVLRLHLPDAPWRPLVASLGYSLGFLVVILGRQQLYTETTLTALLPVMHEWSARVFTRTVRLWTVVLAANLLGAFLFASLAALTPAFSPELKEVFRSIGHEAAGHGPWAAFVKGIVGGWLIALMVWVLPSADAARVWIILALTWVLSAAELTHIVAGSVDTFYLVVVGDLSALQYLGRYGLPVLIGNSIGGVVLVAALNHIQVAAE